MSSLIDLTKKLKSLRFAVVGAGYQMGEWTFVGLLVSIFGGTFLLNKYKTYYAKA